IENGSECPPNPRVSNEISAIGKSGSEDGQSVANTSLLDPQSVDEVTHRAARTHDVRVVAEHMCPNGCGALIMQDKARDAWFCPDCRLWCTPGTMEKLGSVLS